MGRLSLLVVGKLLLHEENIVEPLLKALNNAGVNVFRIGGGTEFFMDAQKPRQIDDWVEGLPDSVAPYDGILFFDFWSPIVPLLCYQMYVEERYVPLIALYHGSTHLDGDVAAGIPHAPDYERYLLQAFDCVLVGSPWVVRKLPSPPCWVTPFPLDIPLSIAGPEPTWKHRNRVVFAGRWQDDKAPEYFESFARTAHTFGIECIATCDPPNPPPPHIVFTGWLSEKDFLGLVKDGGYVWGAARQEMTGYGIWTLVAAGATPLVRDASQYAVWPFPYRWGSTGDAITKVLSGLTFTRAEWERLAEANRGNAANMANAILAACLLRGSTRHSTPL